VKAIVRTKDGQKSLYHLTGFTEIEPALAFVKAEIPNATVILISIK
jgi:hypothetical protein